MVRDSTTSAEDEAALLADETNTMAAAPVTSAPSVVSTSTTLIETSKQTLIEQFVPILLKTREKALREGKDKLNKELLMLLGDFIKDNKRDVKELFQGKSAAQLLFALLIILRKLKYYRSRE